MEIERQLEKLTIDLDVAAREARSRIGKGERRNLSTFAGDSQHLRRLRELLTEMAVVIDRTLRGSVLAAKDRLVNVWTGYDSVLVKERVTAEIAYETRQRLSMLGYDGGRSADENNGVMQTGMIFPSSEGRVDRSALYFDAALAPVAPSRHDDDNTFTVGGTHNWLALGPAVRTGPLVGFEVRTTEGPAERHQSFPVITLDPARPLEWGECIAREIASFCDDSEQGFWPLPVRRSKESRHAYAERLAVEHCIEDHNSIRYRLYSLWLMGCFVSDPIAILNDGRGKRWVEQLLRELEDLEPQRAERIRGLLQLERNLTTDSGFTLSPACFSKWGVLTIPYPIADSRVGDGEDESDELGSAMFLTDTDASPWYYFAIRQWIASYYLSLRQQESSVIRAESEAHKAALDAERQLRRQLSHAIGTELTYVDFLATGAKESIAAEHFSLTTARVAAGVARQGAGLDSTEFILARGVVTPLERQLIDIVLKPDGDNQLSRDVSLIARALAAVPSQAGRNFIGALFEEVERLTVENRALVRVDDPSVLATFEVSDKPRSGEDPPRLVKLLTHALIVALTVYFRKAFPPDGGKGEEVCGESAGALFYGDSAIEVNERGQQCAVAWRNFLAESYRLTGQTPEYARVRQWLLDHVQAQSRIRFDLPPIDDRFALAHGCGEYAPLVVQAWLTEALLNSFKHMRPSPVSGLGAIVVKWHDGDTALEVSNATTSDRASEAVDLVNAAARGERSMKDGHQGIAFLSYAAMHLFPGKKLRAEAGIDALRLQVRESE